MSDSADGLIAPATRQNAGRFGMGCPAGGVKDPAGTDCASEMVVAYEVLEHIPWELFAPSLAEMRRVSKKFVGVSLPDRERIFRLQTSFPPR